MESNSFVVDLETLSNGLDNDLTANSTMLRSNSRKGKLSSRGCGDNMIIPSHPPPLAKDQDTPLFVSTALSAPTAATKLADENCNPLDKPAPPPRATLEEKATELPFNQLPQHQITIRTTSIGGMVDGKALFKRHGSRKSPRSRFLDPRRILLFFATLSSVGTMLLIFFTLTMSKLNQDEIFMD